MSLFKQVQLQMEAEALQRQADGIEPTYRMLAGNRTSRRAPGGAERAKRADEWRRDAYKQLQARQDDLHKRVQALTSELEAANV